MILNSSSIIIMLIFFVCMLIRDNGTAGFNIHSIFIKDSL